MVDRGTDRRSGLGRVAAGIILLEFALGLLASLWAFSWFSPLDGMTGHERELIGIATELSGGVGLLLAAFALIRRLEPQRLVLLGWGIAAVGLALGAHCGSLDSFWPLLAPAILLGSAGGLLLAVPITIVVWQFRRRGLMFGQDFLHLAGRSFLHGRSALIHPIIVLALVRQLGIIRLCHMPVGVINRQIIPRRAELID